MAIFECGRHVLGNSSLCYASNYLNMSLTNVSLSSDKPNSAMFQWVCELYIITGLALVGLFGNLVAIVVMRHDVLRREALLLLQILAVIDAVYLVVALALYPARHLVDSSEIYSKIQLYVYPLLKTCQAATIWLMVLVTVDRYIFVCWPLTAQQWCTGRNRRIMAVFICLAALLFTLPRFFDSCIQEFFDPCTNSTISYRIFTANFNNQYYHDIYQNACYIIFLYVGPLSVLSIVNFKLVQAIRKSRKFQPRGHTSEREYSDSNATLVLIIIVVVFVMCETPELIIKLLTIINKYAEGDFFGHSMVYMVTVCEVLMVLNSSVNFFVYVAFGRRFRYIMKETFMYFTHSNATMTTHETAPLQHLHRHGFPYNNKRFIM